jgi:Caspase domain
MRIASLLLLTALVPGLSAQGGKRVALIIGNDAYQGSPLKNAVNDARAMERALKSAGFQTIEVENAKRADMELKVGEFLDKLGPDDTALFFYAGHGMQIANENFLVPVDFKPADSLVSAKLACMSVAQIFEELKRKRAKVNIVILDACRSNPVTAKYTSEAGLAQPQEAGKQTFIAFSTGPGQVALDNVEGRNSWFTEALADLIEQPSMTLEINEVFTRVKRRVNEATEGKQMPWVISGLSTDFYFRARSNNEIENDPTLAEKWLDDARRREQRQDWNAAIELLNRILNKKPGGTLEEAARNRLPYLMARRDAQARFEAGDYAAAAQLFEQAVKLDSFAADAALQGVNSYLLHDRVPEAVGLLNLIRVRGRSEAAHKANEMLKALAAISPEAGKVLQAGIPQPPPIEEVFGGSHFGTPDWDGGKRRLQTGPVDITRWTRDLKMEIAVPAPIVPAVAPLTPVVAATPLAQDMTAAVMAASVFHVEVVPTGDTRDLRLRQPGPNQQFGYVQFDAPSGDTPVVYEGKQTPITDKLRLIPGKYEVRTVKEGKVLSRQQVQVDPLTTIAIPVKLP